MDKTEDCTDYLSNERPKLGLILMIYARGFGLCRLSEARLLSFGGTLAVRCLEYGGCPYLGGWE